MSRPASVLRQRLPWTAFAVAWFAATLASSGAELLSCRRIWNAAPHNAFTDLAWFHRQWWCVFREGQGHVSPDGAVRVLTSRDGVAWESAALVKSTRGDLRDPKIVEAPGGRLMLVAAIAFPQPSEVRHQTVAWFSRDGRAWGEPVEIGDPNQWVWRVAWRGRHREALGIGYDTTAEKFIRLYHTRDGKRFDTVLPTLFDVGHPNETGIAFEPDGTAVCLLRRDGEPGSGLVGRAKAPYSTWDWREIGVRVGGPQLLRLPDGRFVAAVRLYDGRVRTSLAWLDVEHARLTEFLALPSGGDCSYPGLVWRKDRLGVSYYSSHEGKTSIYFAEVKP